MLLSMCKTKQVKTYIFFLGQFCSLLGKKNSVNNLKKFFNVTHLGLAKIVGGFRWFCPGNTGVPRTKLGIILKFYAFSNNVFHIFHKNKVKFSESSKMFEKILYLYLINAFSPDPFFLFGKFQSFVFQFPLRF